ncbi:MAG: hypothetical protein M1829_004774 [Trizodia sp. TS-e1964]|nr:MAG: hypothetical protein M1829_004774 [Trizodia sp. TS-e1964]
MAAARMDALDGIFDDHPSLTASLDDFEHHGATSEPQRSPLFGIPSHYSGFKSEYAESDLQESDSGGPWNPPGIGGWLRHQPYQHDGLLSYPTSYHSHGSPVKRSRGPSPQHEPIPEADISFVAANTRLPPDSPLKRSPSPSPAPESFKPDQRPQDTPPIPQDSHTPADNGNANNFLRFAFRAEMQHRTEPFEALVQYLKNKIDSLTRSRTSAFLTISIAFISFILMRLLILPPELQPVPDLVKVASLAKAFEPLIFYSENGVQQIGELQETGVAVWDLGESVRSTNMTSAPLIFKELDDLSDSLKTLAMELTRFFANVDGDVDSILIVMEWAKRELAQLSALPNSSLTSVFDNMHSILCRVGVLETPTGGMTAFGKIVADVFGPTLPQRTRATLQRTFNEFLSVLEESINNELLYSTSLFALFEVIDQQFQNLARTVIRESNAQEREEGEMLASLWTKVLGPNAAQLRKYEKNKQLLSNVRAKTVHNKVILVDHNHKLQSLKANLEILRKKLVSPLVRRNNSSTLSVEEQIRGLDGTYEYLSTARERQKEKLMEALYSYGSRRSTLMRRMETIGDEEKDWV